MGYLCVNREKGMDSIMTGTEVLTGSLMDVAADAEELVARYRQSVNRIYAIGQELDSMWDGTANRTFFARMGSDRERFDAMAKLLESYVSVLRHNASIYIRAESDVLDVLKANPSGR